MSGDESSSVAAGGEPFGAVGAQMAQGLGEFFGISSAKAKAGSSDAKKHNESIPSQGAISETYGNKGTSAAAELDATLETFAAQLAADTAKFQQSVADYAEKHFNFVCSREQKEKDRQDRMKKLEAYLHDGSFSPFGGSGSSASGGTVEASGSGWEAEAGSSSDGTGVLG